MDRSFRDLRYALRRVTKNPAFTSIAVLTIAIGIGANVAIFSVVDAVLLEPLPYDSADRLVVIWEKKLESGEDKNVVSPGNLNDWRARAASFEFMAGASMGIPMVLEGSDDAEEVQAIGAEVDYFRVLGIDPVLGKHFSPGEGQQLILTHGLWQRQFGGDPSVIGTVLRVNGNPLEVVGVLPDEYIVFAEGTDLFYSNDLSSIDRTNSGRWLNVIGRLSDGASFEAARSEMLAIADQLQAEDPGFNAGWTVNVLTLKDEVVGDVRTLMMVLLAAVGLLLLIACANVANLLLARGTGRRQELAVRTALGASRTSLGSQLFVESLALAGLGTLAGLGIAHYGTRAIVASMPAVFGLPRVSDAGMDGTVLVFTMLAGGVTAVLFGLLPALQASRTAPARVLSGEARGPGRSSGRARNALVVAEVAVSLVLLVGATLMARSFYELTRVDTGIDPTNVLTARVNLGGDRYDEEQARIQFNDEVMTRITALPGVQAVGGISWLPFAGVQAGTSYWPADRPQPDPEDTRGADILNVTGDYFGAMGIEIVRGRGFDARDHEGSPRVAVVNQWLAELHWPAEDPVGKQVTFNWRDHETVEIVGVAANVRADGLDAAVDEAIWMPYSQTPFFRWSNVVIRATGDPVQMVDRVRSLVREIDPSLPVSEVRIMENILAESIARPRVSAFLMGIFAVAAALLAAIGLYGVLSYAVARRIREIGIRMALGAHPGNVLRMVVVEGGRLIVLGLALGTVGALFATRTLEGVLFGVSARDPLSLLAAAGFLLGVGFVACAVPAARATRVAPVRALAGE